jgi:hypothetical protein
MNKEKIRFEKEQKGSGWLIKLTIECEEAILPIHNVESYGDGIFEKAQKDMIANLKQNLYGDFEGPIIDAINILRSFDRTGENENITLVSNNLNSLIKKIRSPIFE